MTLKMWFGGTGYFNNPSDWSPQGVPQSGDRADIYSGTGIVSNENLTGVTLDIGNTDPLAAPTLVLRNSTVGTIDLGNQAPVPDAGSYQTIEVENHATIAGPVGAFYELQGSLSVDLVNSSILTNAGSISISAGLTEAMSVSGGTNSALVNDGSVVVFDGQATFDTRVIGTGTIELQGSPSGGSEINNTVIYGGQVGGGQTVDFAGQAAAPAVSQIELQVPDLFRGIIDGFSGSELVQLDGISATSEHFVGGRLYLSNSSEVVDQLKFGGSYNSSDFSLSQSGGSTVAHFVGHT